MIAEPRVFTQFAQIDARMHASVGRAARIENRGEERVRIAPMVF